jgi:hypothetical protein
MNLAQLNRRLKKIMKDFIKDEDHIDTGALYRSIRLKLRFTKNKLDIKFSSKDYIVYLEEGNFVKRYFELNDVNEAISDFYVENLQII